MVEFNGVKTKLFYDEVIRIINSFLVKTLVHNNSKNPQIPEVFRILNTVAMHYSNIHGTTTAGVYLGAFSTVDLSVLHDCVIGDYSYVQAGDLSRVTIEPGRVWLKSGDLFEFNYVYPEGVVEKYVKLDDHGQISGKFIEYVDDLKEDFIPIYSTVTPESIVKAPDSAYVSPYAVIKGTCEIGENALVVQRAHIENSVIGKGSNAQENCYIANSIFEGNNVTAHGGKMIWTRNGKNVFVGFNSFIHGTEEYPITIGRDSIVMPHTIIDAEEPIVIPDNSAIWGYVTKQADLATQCVNLDDLAKATDITLGNATFKGDGKAFVEAFKHRIDHIREENGAYFDGSEKKPAATHRKPGMRVSTFCSPSRLDPMRVCTRQWSSATKTGKPFVNSYTQIRGETFHASDTSTSLWQKFPRQRAELVQDEYYRISHHQTPILVATAGPFVAGWVLIGEFIFTLAMALKCYPLPAGGLLAIEAVILGMTQPLTIYHEALNNFPGHPAPDLHGGGHLLHEGLPAVHLHPYPDPGPFQDNHLSAVLFCRCVPVRFSGRPDRHRSHHRRGLWFSTTYTTATPPAWP